MKILIADIETSPNLAYVWGLWDQNVGLSQLVAPTEMLCWAAKWHGARRTIFDSSHHSSRKEMVAHIHSLLDECDVFVHYNGTKFDNKHLNREFLLQGLAPPSPYKQVDLLTAVKRRFNFPSNKLQYVAQALDLGSKTPDMDFATWTACMAGDDKAWRKMARYNRMDVVLTERLYDHLLPWIPNHPNRSTYPGTCATCGEGPLQRRGFHTTSTLRYQRFQCQSCGAWSRAPAADKSTPKPSARPIT